MKYKLNNKIINIPDEEIDMLVESLELTMEEAIDTWLADNDYITNEQEKTLTKKAKDNKVTATIHEAKADKQRAVAKRENPAKEKIIAVLNEALAHMEGISNLEVTNAGKIIEFNYENKKYKLDLIQRRKD